jgi:hypothetical protein
MAQSDERRKQADEAAGGEEPEHLASTTAVAGEAAERGVPPPNVVRQEEEAIPGQDRLLQIGDEEVDPLRNAYSGDEAPGFDMPTPDQDSVDATGRAYGVTEIDSGALKPSAEIADARDRRRAFADEPPDEE